MCRAQDYAWHLVAFECVLATRGTQAPTINREAELRHGSGKIIAARFGKHEKLRCHHSADCVAPYVLTPRIAATIAIEPCHGFERTHFKRLAEYVAGWNRSSASVATFISKHALPPMEIWDGRGISKSTLAQTPFSAPRRGPPALAGLTTLAARPLDHPASAGVFGSRLLRRLTEHPCSISNDSIARACRVSGIAQFEPLGP